MALLIYCLLIAPLPERRAVGTSSVCVCVCVAAQHRQFNDLTTLTEIICILFAFRTSRFRTSDFGQVVVAGYVCTVNCYCDVAASSSCVCNGGVTSK
jgi:hypothetical protein